MKGRKNYPHKPINPIKIFKAYWKIEPTIETKEKEPTEEEILNCLMDITTSPHDYIGFEEIKSNFERFLENERKRIRCKSVKEKKISIKDLEKIKQYIENPVKFQEAISHLIKAGKYQYEMLIALQKQIICLEAKIKILEANIRKLWGGNEN